MVGNTNLKNDTKMKFKTYISQLIFLSSLLLGITACEDYRSHNMVDDTVYLLKPAYNGIDVFQWGDFDYELFVVKSGVGQQDAELELVADKALLDTYNTENGTDYKLLPEDCYTIKNKQLSISKGESSKPFEFVFDAEKIMNLQGVGNIEYVLPCRVNALNSIASEPDRMYSIIAPLVKMPYIGFANAALLNVATIDPTSSDEETFIASIQTNYNNKWNLTYTLSIDPDALIPYNEDKAAKGEALVKLLPADAYTLKEDTWNVPAKMNERDFEFVLNKSKLMDENGTYKFGEYAIPVRVASVSMHGINPDKATQVLPVSFQPVTFNRATWQVIEWSSVREDDGGGIGTVLDGNLDTYWHSMWEPDAALPHYLVIDMQKECEVMAIQLIRRKENTNTKYVTFELSSDGKTFEKVCDMDFGDANNTIPSMEKSIAPRKARYVKCIVHESNNPPHASIAEILVKGIN